MTRYILLTAMLLGGCFCLYSQKQLCFSYDSAGNQTHASVCLNPENSASAGRPALPDDAVEVSTSAENDKIETSREIILKSAPNPTAGELTVYWYHTTNQSLTRLFISSADMRILYDNTHIHSPAEQLQLNISSYVQGVYYLVGIFSDGTKKTVRIIKK